MLWIKAFHIVAVVCWFAGLFYLPRLFVYHAQAEDSISRERFKIMERRLYFGIMWPALVFTVGLGVWLLVLGWSYYKTQGWLHTKLVLVALLVVYHIVCGRFLRAFAADKSTRDHVFFRVFNELPTVILIVVTILVVVRPF